MPKFNKAGTSVRPAAKGYIVTNTRATGRTGEGAPGYARSDEKSELFLLAVTNMVGENTFYEKAGARDERYERLVAAVAVQDPDWIGRFFAWLRSAGNMRTASIVGALESARAMVAAGIPGARAIVASVLQRGDEPGEALAYWTTRYGRKIPKAVKRGIADAAERLFTEYSLLKYDTSSHGFRFADVLDLVHPSAKAPWQGELYKFALARRHNRDEAPGELLTMVRKQAQLRAAVAEGQYDVLLSSDDLREAGFTWEDVLSLAGSKLSKRQLWEALVPTMGYMALLRNLRNFDEAGISDAVARTVADRLANPEQVAKSQQFPFRFLSAHKAVPSLRWGHALEQALNASLANVPELPGRTLVLVDRSGSMFGTLSEKTGLNRADSAAVFGGALKLRNWEQTTLVEFGTSSSEIVPPRGGSLLKLVNQFGDRGGTNTAAAVRQHYSAHNRVVIVTDEQSYDGDPGHVVPANVPLYTWNLAGYRLSSTAGTPNRHTFGGLTDHAFKLIPLLESGRDGTWPF
jgi:TROVE domain-containing protein